jgi:uncharacterized protein
MRIETLVATDLALPLPAVAAVAAMLAEQQTVPFIARYRKEQTGGLDEVAIRNIEERRKYFIELEDRRAAVLSEIEKQGKLTPELRAKIAQTLLKAELEDLYLPFKPKRRTRATIAREKGLEPLAQRILAQAAGTPQSEATAFVNEQVASVEEALQGARDIVAEICAETAEVRALVRKEMLERGALVVSKAPDVSAPTKFEAYYDFRENCATIPSHRFLAVRRGEAENVLRVKLEVDEPGLRAAIASAMHLRTASAWSGELGLAVADAWTRLLAPSVESDARAELKMRADEGAVSIFAQNLRALLLAAPLGARAVIGIDPGQRTGCKIAVVDATGKLLEHTVIYLVQGERAQKEAHDVLLALAHRHKPFCVAIGNGTHGRETERFVRDTLASGELKQIFPVLVSESGASVYSASDVAREEFPDLDLTVRGAISIARRLQDPLAELVKVDPKSIGVGQYQHDVFQPMLAKKLDDVVESCVNHVGVDLNTASAPLLAYVAGIGPMTAKRIAAHREKTGAFRSRAQLLEVAGLGPKTFEQCAGFLRVRGGAEPLDASGVHPERYALVEQIAKDLGVGVTALVGNAGALEKVDWLRYVSAEVGELTLRDIAAELRKPGRDPRDSFAPPQFRDDVRTLEDLKPGMALEGVVTNVTAFGAFVDIGVHQDGLVHVSELADKFVRDPAEVVKAGDRLKVRVLEVDLARKRISLSARSGAPRNETPRADTAPTAPRPSGKRDDRRPAPPPPAKFTNNPFARLLQK